MATTSPYMGLTVPTPSTGATGTGDTGPGYAINISNDLSAIIDSHDHSSGKGVPITPAGLNINQDLTYNNNNSTQVRSTRYFNQASGLNGVGDISNVYVLNGDLWYNNSASTQIQLTSGGSVVASTASNILSRQAVTASTWTIVNTDTYVLLDITTSTGSKSVTLPAANSVTAGRWYVFNDATGNAALNNITINRATTDTIAGNTTLVVNTNYGAAIIASNGSNSWNVIKASNPVVATGISTGITRYTNTFTFSQTGFQGFGNIPVAGQNVGFRFVAGVSTATGMSVGVAGPSGSTVYANIQCVAGGNTFQNTVACAHITGTPTATSNNFGNKYAVTYDGTIVIDGLIMPATSTVTGFCQLLFAAGANGATSTVGFPYPWIEVKPCN